MMRRERKKKKKKTERDFKAQQNFGYYIINIIKKYHLKEIN
jgi:hypothetical protein